MPIQHKRYLGLDLSLSSPGFSVLEVRDRQAYLLTATHVKTNAKETHGYRLRQIVNEMQRLFIEHGPFEKVIRERGFSQHASTTQTLFKVVGCIDMEAHCWKHREIIEIPPTTVKKIVTGDGKADKQTVERAVRRLLRLSDDFTFKTDDESDACAVALAYLIREGIIEGGTG